MKKDNYSSDPFIPAMLQQVAAGDQAAFRKIYGFYFKRLYHFAFAFVKTKETAEEIAEDVFIRIWQQRTGLGSIRNLKVYLYTATKNAALNYLSRKARENITEPFDHIHIAMISPGLSPEQILVTSEMYKKVQEAVEALPPRCKMIFKLIREDNLKYKEVSEILNISVNTIDAQMAIAVKRIAAALHIDLRLNRRSEVK
ncbi:MAG TPA: RNA polymerase sigma-70 factor [Puia sp.]|nr:RNA polymerase sigma-70 factor [Puia sp.]